MRTFVRRPSPGGRVHPFAWWAALWLGATLPLTVAFAAGFLGLLGWLLLPLGPVGWLVLAAIGCWALYCTVAYLSLYTPVVVADDCFYVRVLFWWTPIPWRDVVEMRYAVFPYHLVFVRQRLPFRRFLGAPFFLRGDEPI